MLGLKEDEEEESDRMRSEIRELIVNKLSNPDPIGKMNVEMRFLGSQECANNDTPYPQHHWFQRIAESLSRSRECYDQPKIEYFHREKSGEATWQYIHTEKVPDFEYFNNDLVVRLYNSRLEVEGQFQNKRVVFNYTNPFKVLKDGEVYSKDGVLDHAHFEGRRVVVKDSKLFDETLNEDIDVSLHGTTCEYLVDKAEFYASQNECHVVVLFEAGFVGQGKIRLHDQKLIASITEVVGSFGTIDFVCSPDFESIVCFSQFKPKFRSKEGTVREAMCELQKEMNMTKKLLTARTSKVKVKHGEENESLLRWCNATKSLLSLLRELERNEKWLTFMDSWFVRDKFAVITRHNQSVSRKDCKSEDTCTTVDNLLKSINKIVEKKSSLDPKEFVEVAKRAKTSLKALNKILNPSGSQRNTPIELSSYRLSVEYQSHWEMDPSTMVEHFPDVDPEMKETVLDAILSRIDSRGLNSVMRLYENPEYAEMVFNAFKQRPHLLVFGRVFNEMPASFQKAWIKWIRSEYYPDDKDHVFLKNNSQFPQYSGVTDTPRRSVNKKRSLTCQRLFSEEPEEEKDEEELPTKSFRLEDPKKRPSVPVNSPSTLHRQCVGTRKMDVGEELLDFNFNKYSRKPSCK